MLITDKIQRTYEANLHSCGVFMGLSMSGFKKTVFFLAKGRDNLTLRDRDSLLFLLGERREEPLLATARFFDLAAVHGQGRIN